MARESGLIASSSYLMPYNHVLQGIKAFEALVRADERAAHVQEPASSNVQAKWLGNALFDCIKASGIIREDIGSLSVGELLFFSKDLKGMLERQAATPAAAPMPLTDEQIDAATKAWFENDIVAGQNPFRKRMRAAFAAAHGITGKGQP
jgi:hypothetical protein